MPPLLFPMLAPLLGQIAIWGAGIGLSTAALTGIVTAVSYGLQIGIGLGIAFLGNKLFAPKMPKPEDRQVLVRESTHPRARNYGRVKVSGVLAYLSTKSGALYRVIVTGTGQIDAIEEHWIDDAAVTIDGSGDVTGPDPYTDRINIKYKLGTDTQTAYSDLVSEFPSDWTTDHQGLGMSHALVRLNPIKAEKFPKVYPRGEPNYRQVLRGAKVYDPREAGHDPDDPTTWEWSENAALCILDYMTHADGMALDRTYFDDTDWSDAANDCDDAISLKAGGTAPRYVIGFTYDFLQRPADVLASMLRACDGQIVPTSSGGLKLVVGKWVTPTVTIDDDAIVDYNLAPGAGVMEAANVIKARFTSPDHDYQATEADEWRDETDITARGELVSSQDYFAVPNHAQCRRLMKLMAYRLNPAWSGTLTLNNRGFAVMGERFITLQLSELGIDQDFEVTGDPEIILGDENTVIGVRLSVSALSSDAYDWNAATEEGTAPATGDVSLDSAVEDMSNLSASVEQRTVSGSQKVAVAVISWDAPVNTGLKPQVEIKLSSGSDATWQGLNIATDQDQTETGVLIDGEDYDIRGRFISPAGLEGDWTTPVITITAVANTTAPSDVTSVTITSGVESVALSFNTPNDANFVKARIYRKTTNVSSTATHVQDVYLSQNISAAITLASAPLGDWYYWVAASNGSNIEGTRVAASPAPIAVLGAELTTNGTFAADTNWTKGTGWSIAAGVATKVPSGTATTLSQSITFTAGYIYRVTFTVTARVAGSVTPRLSGGTNVVGTARSAAGTFSEDLTAVTGNNSFDFVGGTGGDLSIDNVSVKRAG